MDEEIYKIDGGEFWERTNSLLKKKGITQKSLAEQLKCNSPDRINNLSARKVLPDVQELYGMSIILGTTMETLVTGNEQAELVRTKKQIKSLFRSIEDLLNL